MLGEAGLRIYQNYACVIPAGISYSRASNTTKYHSSAINAAWCAVVPVNII